MQRFIEGGLFEYILVLYPVRKLGSVGDVLATEGSMSGRLGVYLLNVLFGGFITIITVGFFIFFVF